MTAGMYLVVWLYQRPCHKMAVVAASDPYLFPATRNVHVSAMSRATIFLSLCLPCRKHDLRWTLRLAQKIRVAQISYVLSRQTASTAVPVERRVLQPIASFLWSHSPPITAFAGYSSANCPTSAGSKSSRIWLYLSVASRHRYAVFLNTCLSLYMTWLDMD